MNGAENVKPYNDAEAKGKQVVEMIDSIAPAYDFMNTGMTGGLHRYWRNRALRMAARRLEEKEPQSILDVACGTGDVAFRLHRLYPQARITGLDLSAGMLRIAEGKLAEMPAPARERISFMEGDSLALPFGDDTFDLVTVAYGVRNFERLEDGYREMLRVLRPGGVICVVELSEPAAQPARGLYKFYSGNIIPMMGRFVSHDARAYSYLPESIAACAQREAMTSLLEKAGFRDARC